MLEILARQDLSVTTLLFSFLVPFAFFALHINSTQDDGRLKGHELLLIVVSLGLASFGIFKFSFLKNGASYNEKIITILHIGPPVLTLLMISKLRQLGLSLEKLRSATAPAPTVNSPIPPGEESPVRSCIAEKHDDNLSWADLILNEEVYEEVTQLLKLYKNAASASDKGLLVSFGVLLQGPPGTGKTSIARLLAKSTGLSFFNLHTSDIMSGAASAEKSIQEIIQSASKAAPSLLFIDEIDLIGKCRDNGPNPQADGMLRQLLQLVDQVEKTPKLYLIAATNRSDLVDEALKRPGRLSKVISTNLPDPEEREAIFRLCLARLPLEEEIDLEDPVARSEGASGATIKAICNQAGINALQRFNDNSDMQGHWSINNDDVANAVSQYMKRSKKLMAANA